MIHPAIYIKTTPGKGRGVFTKKRMGRGTKVEDSPVIVMEMDDFQKLDKTLLQNYIFDWGDRKRQCALALGYLSLFNHSYESNCEYFMRYDKETMYIKTVKEVAAGEELTINYHGDWNNKKKVWFDVKNGER